MTRFEFLRILLKLSHLYICIKLISSFVSIRQIHGIKNVRKTGTICSNFCDKSIYSSFLNVKEWKHRDSCISMIVSDFSWDSEGNNIVKKHSSAACIPSKVK